ALPGDFNYVIGADKLSLASSSPLNVSGTAGNESPNVTILAVEINGPFSLECRGRDGTPGTPGGRGTDGQIIIVNGKPKFIPPNRADPAEQVGQEARAVR